MSGASHGQQEGRTRVMCHLPLRNTAEDKAFTAVINYLQQQQKEHIGVTGYTFSDRTAFHGFWWSPDQQIWVEDQIVLLIVDYKIPLADPEYSWFETIGKLKEAIQAAYARFGSPQEEVWVVAHPITRAQ